MTSSRGAKYRIYNRVLVYLDLHEPLGFSPPVRGARHLSNCLRHWMVKRAFSFPPCPAGLRANLACGDDYRSGFVNVDIRPTGDIVGDVTSLPFASGSVAYLVVHDILEHFPRSRTDGLLSEWVRILAPDGLMDLKVPNLRRLGYHVSRLHKTHYPSAVENLYGGHRWGPDGGYDAHHWGWTADALEATLRSHGLLMVYNDHALNMRAVARRPTCSDL